MASSSDWVAELAHPTAGPPDKPQSWVDAFGESGEFVEGAPFAAPAPDTSPPEQPERPLNTAPVDQEVEPDPKQQAFERGKAEGRAQAEAEAQETLADQRKLRLAFRALDTAATDSLATSLAETVLALCSAAIADFRVDPDGLAERCEQAAKRLGSAASECKLHLHPEDIEQLDPETHEAWTVVADETVERAGLRFEGPEGSVSDSPEDWRRAIAAAIKG